MGDIIGDVSLESDHDHGNVSTDSRCAQNKSCCGTVDHPFGQRMATRLLLVIFRTGLLPTHDKVTGSLRSLTRWIVQKSCPRTDRWCAFGRSPHCEVLLAVPHLQESSYMNIRPLVFVNKWCSPVMGATSWLLYCGSTLTHSPSCIGYTIFLAPVVIPTLVGFRTGKP